MKCKKSIESLSFDLLFEVDSTPTATESFIKLLIFGSFTRSDGQHLRN